MGLSVLPPTVKLPPVVKLHNSQTVSVNEFVKPGIFQHGVFTQLVLFCLREFKFSFQSLPYLTWDIIKLVCNNLFPLLCIRILNILGVLFFSIFVTAQTSFLCILHFGTTSGIFPPSLSLSVLISNWKGTVSTFSRCQSVSCPQQDMK